VSSDHIPASELPFDEEPDVSAESQGIPQASFLTLVQDLGTRALLALGMVPTHSGAEPVINLGIAKYSIDSMGVLRDVAKGNISTDEKRFIDEVIANCQLAYATIQERAEELSELADAANDDDE
jgi:hypothetical protein